MGDPAQDALLDRINRLERDLKELRLRIAALEKRAGASAEHAVDRTAVREKVAYDWQG